MTPAPGLRPHIPGIKLSHKYFRRNVSIFLLSSAILHNISCTGAITANWPTLLIKKVPRFSTHDEKICLYIGFPHILLGPHLRHGSCKQ